MAPNEDLKAHATSTFDFYELLNLSTDFSQKELDRARRLTSFKYHPDKVGDDASAREKLHLTNVGYELLGDPQLRVLYDNTRSARERKKASEAHLEAGRRKLKEDLEVRERAGRGSAGEQPGRETWPNESEQRLRALAEDGKQRRLKLQARREQEYQSSMQQSSRSTEPAKETKHKDRKRDVPDLDRSVKVIFMRVPNVAPPTSKDLVSCFDRFGEIDSAFVVQEKHAKKANSDGVARGTAYVVFVDQAAALSSIQRWTTQKDDALKVDGFWDSVYGISWAGGEEPEGLQQPEKNEQDAGITTPEASDVERSMRNPFAQGLNGEPSLEEQALQRLSHAASTQVQASTA